MGINQESEPVPAVSPSFSVNIDFNRNTVSDKNVIPVQKPQKPVPRFPERIPAPLTVAAAPPSPPPPQPSPAPIFIDVTSAPLLPQAVPAVPGRPIVSDQSISSLASSSSSSISSLASSSSSLADKPVNTFIPMPVPAVPGI